MASQSLQTFLWPKPFSSLPAGGVSRAGVGVVQHAAMARLLHGKRRLRWFGSRGSSWLKVVALLGLAKIAFGDHRDLIRACFP